MRVVACAAGPAMRTSTPPLRAWLRSGAAEQLVDPPRRDGHQRECFGMCEIVRHVGYPGVIITDTGGTIAVVFAPMTALRRTFYDLRTEGQGRAREACAIGVGLFIGCSPFYGFHLCSAGSSAGCSRLNRLKRVPGREHFESHRGAVARVRRGPDRRMDPHRRIPPAHTRNGKDHHTMAVRGRSLVGSAVVGSVLGAIGGMATYLALGGAAHAIRSSTNWRAQPPTVTSRRASRHGSSRAASCAEIRCIETYCSVDGCRPEAGCSTSGADRV